jgi:hypothetical protein
MTVTGTDFGVLSSDANGPLLNVSALSVAYGTFTATGCAVSFINFSHSKSLMQAVCDSSPGFGINLTVSVTVGGLVSLGSVTTSYVSPAITSVTCIRNGVRTSLMNTAGGTVEINGTDFGPAGTGNTPVVTLSGLGAIGSGGLTVTGCQLAVSHTSVTCTVGANVGTSFTPTLSVAGYVNITSIGLTFAFDAPNISELQLTSTNPGTMATAGGDRFTLTGTSFGPTTTPVTAAYASTASPQNNYSPTCNVTVAHTQITCVTLPGVGANLVFSMFVGGQLAVAAQTLSYTAPAISQIATTTVRLNTRGGNLTISGTNLGAPNPKLGTSVSCATIDQFASVAYSFVCTTISSSSIVCSYPPGVGSLLTCNITIGGQTAPPFASGLSYAKPIISDIQGGPFRTFGGENATIIVSGFGET